MRRRSLAALLPVAAVAAAAAADLAGSSPSPPPTSITAAAKQVLPPLGILQARQPLVPSAQKPLRLARIDPGTLRPLPGKRISVGSGGCAPRSGGEACWSIPPWTVSPDRSLLAVGRNERRGVRSLRVIDPKRMRVVADIRVGGGAVGGLAWLTRRRVLAVQEVCCSERQRLVVVDLAGQRVVERRALPGSVHGVGRTSRELVLLLAPANAIGAARLAIADRSGAVRVVRLRRILAGVERLDRSGHRVEQRLPALAVDPEGRRAFVVEPGLVAEVHLARLAVSYHELAQPASVLARLRDWLDPAAQAKGASGPARSARWLGNGLLAVAGADQESFTDARGVEQTRILPAGLGLVDTRNWKVRAVDRGATDFLVAGDLLLASGWSWDSVTGEVRSIGLAVYGFDGRKRFQLFPGDQAWVARVYDGRAYVGISRPDGRQEPLRVVNLVAGRVVGERALALPWLVTGGASSWWEG
jgi:hypothetical protein